MISDAQLQEVADVVYGSIAMLLILFLVWYIVKAIHDKCVPHCDNCRETTTKCRWTTTQYGTKWMRWCEPCGIVFHKDGTWFRLPHAKEKS